MKPDIVANTIPQNCLDIQEGITFLDNIQIVYWWVDYFFMYVTLWAASNITKVNSNGSKHTVIRQKLTTIWNILHNITFITKTSDRCGWYAYYLFCSGK